MAKLYKIKANEFIERMTFNIWYDLSKTKIYLNSFQYCYFAELWNEIEITAFLEKDYQILLNDHYSQFMKVKNHKEELKRGKQQNKGYPSKYVIKHKKII